MDTITSTCMLRMYITFEHNVQPSERNRVSIAMRRSEIGHRIQVLPPMDID